MHDQDVRIAMRSALERDHENDRDTRIVEEMGIWSGTVRIDIAVINGELSGFELKSARDTLQRLPQQAELYSQVFDRMTIVTAENHLPSCLKTLPNWWGVIVASGNISAQLSLHKFRDGFENPSISDIQLARLLWRSEALKVLEHYKIDKGLRSKTVADMHKRLADELDTDTLRKEVRAHLKSREQWLR